MSDKQTVSTLLIPGLDYFLYLMADPWVDNKPNVSCIPKGLYSLVPHNSKDHPNTWAMVNPHLDVYHLPEDIPAEKKGYARWGCLLHPGNWARDFKGCEGPGFGYNGVDMVENSGAAMQLIRNTLEVGSMNHELLILEPRGR